MPLRKKVAYLEDKVAYLTELYKVISEEPKKILKKTVHRAQETCPNLRRLCIIAEVSPKCLYAHLKGPSDKEISDEALIILIKQIQQEYGNSVRYRKMQDRLHDDYKITIGRQKVLHLMGTANMLSAVRRKHFTEEYYVRRREMKNNVPPDLIGRNFCALEPFKRFSKP